MYQNKMQSIPEKHNLSSFTSSIIQKPWCWYALNHKGLIKILLLLLYCCTTNTVLTCCLAVESQLCLKHGLLTFIQVSNCTKPDFTDRCTHIQCWGASTLYSYHLTAFQPWVSHNCPQEAGLPGLPLSPKTVLILKQGCR